MISAQVNSQGQQLLAELEERLWQGLQRATVFYHTKLLEALNVSNPRPHTTPSLPGQPPRKRTGWGQRHVVYSLDRHALSSKIGVSAGAAYMLHLELGTSRVEPRPWLLATLDRHRDRLTALILGET